MDKGKLLKPLVAVLFVIGIANAILLMVQKSSVKTLNKDRSSPAYNNCAIYYKRKNFPRSLAFGLESLRYCKSDNALEKICAAYLRMGMLKEYMEVYEKIEDKSRCQEIKALLHRMKLSTQTVGKYLEKRITMKRLHDLSKEISEGKVIPEDVLKGILDQGENLLLGCENVVYVESKGEVIVFGDTHGQYFDIAGVLNEIFDKERTFIFNGDYVDRGTHSVENFALLLSLKILFPERVHLTRGNHELMNINERYGFFHEVRRKYPHSSDSVYRKFQAVFRALPISIIVNEKVFVTHGGLPETPVNIDELQKLYRMTDEHKNELLSGLLWSDPEEMTGVKKSKRGAGVIFGKDVTSRFLEENGLDLLVRSHEAAKDGYKVNHEGRTVTVFSAPDYEGTKSFGSYLVLYPSKDGGEDVINVSHLTKYKVERFGKSGNSVVLKLSCD
ncbi:ser/thr protein phosphatase 5 [Encephalitozoon hellem]|uniref:Ser/thr protein phosphatase 5 n=2 Tax=Encephalitozoon hellem TaxID=27973 RepID=A0A9Q9CA69_ENCHE|nr:ser/thr protein phosphatase 5 [Encephalitozoon hellem]WEL38595.1 ser/thr protein phosphatase 5 [Encephalitozoon hellem]